MGQASVRGAPGAAVNRGPKPCLCEAGGLVGEGEARLHRPGSRKEGGAFRRTSVPVLQQPAATC